MPVELGEVSLKNTTSCEPGLAGSKLGMVMVIVLSSPKHWDAEVGLAAAIAAASAALG